MTAYDSARYHDLLERKGRGEQLTPLEEARLDRLHAAHEKEQDARPRPWLLGGDYVDVF